MRGRVPGSGRVAAAADRAPQRGHGDRVRDRGRAAVLRAHADVHYAVAARGLVFRVTPNGTADIVAADALPGRGAGVVAQPAPPADRESSAGRRLAAAI